MKTTRKQFLLSIIGALMGRRFIHKPRGPGTTTLAEAINEGVGGNLGCAPQWSYCTTTSAVVTITSDGIIEWKTSA